jgi:hypothetical protein
MGDDFKDYRDSQLRSNEIYNIVKNFSEMDGMEFAGEEFVSDVIQNYERRFNTKLTNKEVLFINIFGTHIVKEYLDIEDAETPEELFDLISERLLKVVSNYLYFSIDSFKLEQEIADLKQRIEDLETEGKP